jgi:hypothetical protein
MACKRIDAARMGGVSNHEAHASDVYPCLLPIRKTFDRITGRAPSKYYRQAIRRLRRNGL